MIIQEEMIITSQQEIARHIFEMKLQGKLVHEVTSPGQFVHIRVGNALDMLLRRPISIAAINRVEQEITIIYRAEGAGTRRLAEKQVGDSVDVLGPLGNGFPVNKTNEGETAYLIGGGIGVPPLYELSKQLTEKGVQCVHILGFQSEDVVFYEEEFNALGETYIVTVDGTKGTEGFVTSMMEKLPQDFATFYSCGPMPMLKAVEEMYAERKGFLSFEQRMGCGVGACFACVCETTEEVDVSYIKVCSDGPVFPAGVVAL